MITGPPDAWIERNADDPDDPYFEGGEPEEEPLENQEIDLEKSQNPGEWEQIENQLNYWADMDRQYWQQRKEKEYRAYFERKLKNAT